MLVGSFQYVMFVPEINFGFKGIVIAGRSVEKTKTYRHVDVLFVISFNSLGDISSTEAKFGTKG